MTRPTMTRRERAAVVELLRCAADLALSSLCAFPFMDAIQDIGVSEDSNKVSSVAVEAFRAATPADCPLGKNYGERMLEAAQRVEEGSWPNTQPRRR